MEIGLNVGYSHTKCVGGSAPREVIFPSVTGTPDRARFALNAGGGIVLTEPLHLAVGEEAVEQSRFINRREDRRWVESEEWLALALAALTEITTANAATLKIVAGLPVAFFADEATVRERLVGTHRVAREGRSAQSLTVEGVAVIPEPFGTLFDQIWDNGIKPVGADIATGHVGIIDVGGKTTNILSVKRAREIGHQTTSVNVGGWKVVEAVRGWLAKPENCPNLDLRDHEVVEAVQKGAVSYYGKPVSLEGIVGETTTDLAAQIVSQATQLWNGAAALDAILVTGGGALMLGERLTGAFPQARAVKDPVMANARGFWKYARHLARR